MINDIFSISIYQSKVENQSVQKELEMVYDDLKANDKFQYNDWLTHKLSSPNAFGRNIISDYGLKNFEREIDKHLIEYLTNLNYRAPALKYTIRSCWMTNFGYKDYAHTHNHGFADISGCYYVKTDGSDGDFIFENPNLSMSSSKCFMGVMNSRYKIKPEVGKLILFPGWLMHSVGTNKTNNERVSVSFNIRIQDDV